MSSSSTRGNFLNLFEVTPIEELSFELRQRGHLVALPLLNFDNLELLTGDVKFSIGLISLLHELSHRYQSGSSANIPINWWLVKIMI